MNDTKSASNAPTHIFYLVDKDVHGKNYYTRIGTGWAHRKGGGINFKLDGQLIVFPAPEQSA